MAQDTYQDHETHTKYRFDCSSCYAKQQAVNERVKMFRKGRTGENNNFTLANLEKVNKELHD